MEASEEGVKAPYTPPEIIDYGAVSDLTEVGSNVSSGDHTTGYS